MSTFGKKYLNYWPYRFIGDSCLRWNKTDKDFQLELLKKWYPIGMRGKPILAEKTTGGNLYEITGYIEHMWGWQLDVFYVDIIFGKIGTKFQLKKDVHPLKFIPEEEDRLRILREIRLDKLLN